MAQRTDTWSKTDAGDTPALRAEITGRQSFARAPPEFPRTRASPPRFSVTPKAFWTANEDCYSSSGQRCQSGKSPFVT